MSLQRQKLHHGYVVVKHFSKRTDQAQDLLNRCIFQERNAHIYLLSEMGLDRQAVGDIYGLTRQRISQIVLEFEESLKKDPLGVS